MTLQWANNKTRTTDATQAADHMEKLSKAIVEAGTGQYSAFKLISELKKVGISLFMEEIVPVGETIALRNLIPIADDTAAISE